MGALYRGFRDRGSTGDRGLAWELLLIVAGVLSFLGASRALVDHPSEGRGSNILTGVRCFSGIFIGRLSFTAYCAFGRMFFYFLVLLSAGKFYLSWSNGSWSYSNLLTVYASLSLPYGCPVLWRNIPYRTVDSPCVILLLLMSFISKSGLRTGFLWSWKIGIR